MNKKLLPAAALGIVLTMNNNHQGYVDHWYWDNIIHFLSGFVLGFILPEGNERESFIALATLWETFEWWSITSGFSERNPRLPQRAMGTPEWSYDHQIEDTILDTIVGLWGVKLARLIKQ